MKGKNKTRIKKKQKIELLNDCDRCLRLATTALCVSDENGLFCKLSRCHMHIQICMVFLGDNTI